MLLCVAGTKDVIGDNNGAGGNAFAVEPGLRPVEIENIARVIAIAEEDSRAPRSGVSTGLSQCCLISSSSRHKVMDVPAMSKAVV